MNERLLHKFASKRSNPSFQECDLISGNCNGVFNVKNSNEMMIVLKRDIRGRRGRILVNSTVAHTKHLNVSSVGLEDYFWNKTEVNTRSAKSLSSKKAPWITIITKWGNNNALALSCNARHGTGCFKLLNNCVFESSIQAGTIRSRVSKSWKIVIPWFPEKIRDFRWGQSRGIGIRDRDLDTLIRSYYFRYYELCGIERTVHVRH